MSKTIASIIFVIAAGQAHAEGFRPWDTRAVSGQPERIEQAAQTSHTPWYFQAQSPRQTSKADPEQVRIARLGPYYLGGQS